MTTTPQLSLVAAVAQNRALGKNNQLLWHLPNDLQFFKRTTLTHFITYTCCILVIFYVVFVDVTREDRVHDYCTSGRCTT